MRRFIRLPLLALLASALVLVGAVSLASAGDGHHHRGGDWHSHGHSGCSWHRVSGLDERWLKVHAETNLFEIAGGQLAESRAATEAVRDLGAELVRDHTVSLAQTRAVAARVGVELPNQPSPLQDWASRAVQQFTGRDFDRWFADLQVQGHKQAIVEATTEASRGCNPKVRRLASASLPVLQMHLEHSEAVLGELGG